MYKSYMRVLLISLVVVFSITTLRAQELSEDLVNLKLPSLDELFEGAKKGPTVEFYNYRMEGEELSLKTERRRWLEYINLLGTYQYGVIGINSYTDIGSDYPLVYQYSAGEQLWYNIGASARIPLDRLFDRRNRIKRQQLKIQETLKERDMWHNDQKLKIIQGYTVAIEMRNSLKITIEQYSFASAQFESIQRDYIMGAATAQMLGVAKSQQTQAFLQLERIKAQLYSSILSLEILSNIKIISK